MSILYENPENMTTIINIQSMERIIGEGETPFSELEHKTHNELFNLQNELIPFYNQAINT